MIYKLISKVGEETFAAIVGTEDEDQFILDAVRPALPEGIRADENKKGKGKLVRQGTTAIGFSSAQVAEVFENWKRKSPYAFVKNDFELHDYAYQTSEEFNANNDRPFEGMRLLRRMLIRPLLVVNLKTDPSAIKAILEQTSEVIEKLNSQSRKPAKGLQQPPDKDTKG
jgi:hypothetical protein